MKKDRYYTIPPEDAYELQRAGYVKITNMDGDLDQFDEDFDVSGREQPDISSREMAINPKAATRKTRKAK
jgi:hypothetical protein